MKKILALILTALLLISSVSLTVAAQQQESTSFIPESAILAKMDFDSVYDGPTVLVADNYNADTIVVPSNAPTGFKYRKENAYWSGVPENVTEIVADETNNLCFKNGWKDGAAFAGFTSDYSSNKPINNTYVSFNYKSTQENPNEVFGKLVFNDATFILDMEYSNNELLFNILTAFPSRSDVLSKSDNTIIAFTDKTMLSEWHEYGINITEENGCYVFTGYLDGVKQNTYKSNVATTSSTLSEYYIGAYEEMGQEGYGYIDDIIIANGSFLTVTPPDEGGDEPEEPTNEFLPESSILANMDFDSVYGEPTVLTASTAGNGDTIAVHADAPAGFRYKRENKYWSGREDSPVEIVADNGNLCFKNGWGDSVVYAGFDSNYNASKVSDDTYVSFRYKSTDEFPNEVYAKLLFSDNTEIIINLEYSSTGTTNGLSIAPAIDQNATSADMVIIPIAEKTTMQEWHEYGIHITKEDGYYTFTGYFDRVKQNTYKSDKTLNTSKLFEFFVGNYEVYQRDGYGYIDDIIIANGSFLTVTPPDEGGNEGGETVDKVAKVTNFFASEHSLAVEFDQDISGADTNLVVVSNINGNKMKSSVDINENQMIIVPEGGLTKGTVYNIFIPDTFGSDTIKIEKEYNKNFRIKDYELVTFDDGEKYQDNGFTVSQYDSSGSNASAAVTIRNGKLYFQDMTYATLFYDGDINNMLNYSISFDVQHYVSTNFNVFFNMTGKGILNYQGGNPLSGFGWFTRNGTRIRDMRNDKNNDTLWWQSAVGLKTEVDQQFAESPAGNDVTFTANAEKGDFDVTLPENDAPVYKYTIEKLGTKASLYINDTFVDDYETKDVNASWNSAYPNQTTSQIANEKGGLAFAGMPYQGNATQGTVAIGTIKITVTEEVPDGIVISDVTYLDAQGGKLEAVKDQTAVKGVVTANNYYNVLKNVKLVAIAYSGKQMIAVDILDVDTIDAGGKAEAEYSFTNLSGLTEIKVVAWESFANLFPYTSPFTKN